MQEDVIKRLVNRITQGDGPAWLTARVRPKG